MICVDLNCDLGEGCGADEQLMPLITSANIACGGHAGDEHSMRAAVRLANSHGVNIGAHPSFIDREHFGRHELKLPGDEIRRMVADQLTALREIALTEGATLRHVKPHGALYNLAARDAAVADAIAAAVRQIDPSLMLFGLAGSELLRAARSSGLRGVSECFADRTYCADGSLTPRSQSNALIEREEDALQQALMMIQRHRVLSTSGQSIPMRAGTVCVHGDGVRAASLLAYLRNGLVAANVLIARPT